MELDDETEEKTSNEFRLEWSSASTSLGFDLRSGLPSEFSVGYAIPVQGPIDNRKPTTGRILTSHAKHKSQIYTKKSPTGNDYILQRKLREAANSCDINYIQRLINGGVNPSGADSKQRTPLHFAATQGNENVVKVLLNSGANPNAKDLNGNTALHLAACTNRVKIVTLLLRAGTDINAVDHTGRTPLEVAKSTLRVVHGDENIRAVPMRYKEEVLQIIDMLKEFLSRAGMSNEEQELNELCTKLDQTSTAEQVDQVHELLSSFTSLSLSRSNAKGDS